MAGGIQREVIVIKALSLDLHDRNIVRKISQIIEPQNAIEGTGGVRMTWHVSAIWRGR
jgi:hypothetical protein